MLTCAEFNAHLTTCLEGKIDQVPHLCTEEPRRRRARIPAMDSVLYHSEVRNLYAQGIFRELQNGKCHKLCTNNLISVSHVNIKDHLPNNRKVFLCMIFRARANIKDLLKPLCLTLESQNHLNQEITKSTFGFLVVSNIAKRAILNKTRKTLGISVVKS